VVWLIVDLVVRKINIFILKIRLDDLDIHLQLLRGQVEIMRALRLLLEKIK
jgi:hypothetical protein